MTQEKRNLGVAVEPDDAPCWCCQDGIADWDEILVRRILDDILESRITAGRVCPIGRCGKTGMRPKDIESALDCLEQRGLIRRLDRSWFEALDVDSDSIPQPNSTETEGS